MRKEHRERINLIIKEEKHDGTDYETLYEETDFDEKLEDEKQK